VQLGSLAWLAGQFLQGFNHRLGNAGQLLAPVKGRLLGIDGLHGQAAGSHLLQRTLQAFHLRILLAKFCEQFRIPLLCGLRCCFFQGFQRFLCRAECRLDFQQLFRPQPDCRRFGIIRCLSVGLAHQQDKHEQDETWLEWYFDDHD